MVEPLHEAHPRPGELELLLEEYRALRAEISGTLQTQHTALSYGFAAVALFIVAVAAAWDKSPKLTAVALMVILPVGISFLMTVWGMEVGRMKRAGSYIGGYLELRINHTAQLESALVWEQWLAGAFPSETLEHSQFFRALRWTFFFWRKPKSRSLRFSHFVVILILTFLATTSFAVGAYRFDSISRVQVRCFKNPQASPEFCKQEGIVQKGQAPWYYRTWRLPSWPSFWKAWEFWSMVTVFMVLPFVLAARLIWEHNRPFRATDLPHRLRVREPEMFV